MSNPALLLDQYRIREEPYYRPLKDEVELFGAAYASRMPVMLKGPTGCGKKLLAQTLARIIDVDTDPFRHRVTIDAGARQGVAVGEAVLDAHVAATGAIVLSTEANELVLQKGKS